jgi:SAM-dependent methyltransferase
MSLRKRASSVLKNPRSLLSTLRARLDPLRYWGPQGYRAGRYWSDRLARFRSDLRGVGNASLTSAENEKLHREGAQVFLSLCRGEGIDFPRARLLDIGCGTGYYASLFREGGGKSYLGADITSVLFPDLRSRFPGFSFRRIDVSRERLEGAFDLVIMIDVAQHITSPEGFAFAMKNVRESLAPGGRFIVTSWLDRNARRSFYEIARGEEDYRAAFPGWRMSAPLPFRDKKIFSLRPPNQGSMGKGKEDDSK